MSHLHTLPEQWLRSRFRGWMEMVESPDLAYWAGCYTADGKWICCSSHGDQWHPNDRRQQYAMNVNRHVNVHASHGGAWMTGWIKGGHVFYLCWKDPDGDIQIPIECDKPFVALKNYTNFDWERHCNAAYGVYADQKRNLELAGFQEVKRAQGQKTSEELAAQNSQ